MKIAVASGKGGTGKTTVAVNLAVFLGRKGSAVQYLDCDVEEPNGHLFLKPDLSDTEEVSIPVPVIDKEKCTACGACSSLCRYNAIARLGEFMLVFPELCHGCGGCLRICPVGAITEVPGRIGVKRRGTFGENGHGDFTDGLLDIGVALSPPLIKSVLREARDSMISIIDAPPGTSCPAVAAMKQADFVLLVTEPTPFGLYDLGLAADVVLELGIPFGVVVNRSESGNTDAEIFCKSREMEIIGRIPFDRRIAEAYSSGKIIVDAVKETAEYFEQIWNSILSRINK